MEAVAKGDQELADAVLAKAWSAAKLNGGGSSGAYLCRLAARTALRRCRTHAAPSRAGICATAARWRARSAHGALLTVRYPNADGASAPGSPVAGGPAAAAPGTTANMMPATQEELVRIAAFLRLFCAVLGAREWL